jgi:DNA polymerase III epsilon subunit-like protein
MSTLNQLGLFGTSDITPAAGATTDKISRRVTLNVDFATPPNVGQFNGLVRDLEENISKLDPSARYSIDYHDREKAWSSLPFFSLDVETTGLDPAGNRVVELAMVPFNMPSDETTFEQLFFVDEPLSKEITALTGITDDMLQGQPRFAEKTQAILDKFSKASFILAYNAKFDRPFVESEFARADLSLPDIPWVDPFVFVCELDRYKKGKKLTDCAKRWGVRLENAHRAKGDAMAAGELMMKMAEMIDCYTFKDLLEKQKVLQWRQAHNMAEYKKQNLWSINR